MGVIRTGWWTFGPVSRNLEAEFAGTIGVEHAAAVSSGTAALHLAFIALGLEPGDRVLMPSLNFVAAANTLLHAGGVPVFADVDSPSTPLVSVETLKRALVPGVKGLCVMHYGGYPCEMDAIAEFARENGLWIIEDAAHAPGATWKGIPCGAWGDAACFSFFGNKNITCGEGGMLVTRRPEVAERVCALRSHGMDLLTWDRYKGHGHSYDVRAAGFNYRIDDVRASLLQSQLPSLERINRLRAERTSWYRRMLQGSGRWSVPFLDHPGDSSYHLFVVVLDSDVSREKVMRGLKDRGIQTSIHYPPIHGFSHYRNGDYNPGLLEVTESLGRHLLTLPLYPDLTFEQVAYVCEALSDEVSSS